HRPGLLAPRERGRARLRLRRPDRVVPRLLCAREGGAARTEGRRRLREPSGAGRRDHCRSGLRALGRTAVRDLLPCRDRLDHGVPACPERAVTAPPAWVASTLLALLC